jgi:hypothetical protein
MRVRHGDKHDRINLTEFCASADGQSRLIIKVARSMWDSWVKARLEHSVVKAIVFSVHHSKMTYFSVLVFYICFT